MSDQYRTDHCFTGHDGGSGAAVDNDGKAAILDLDGTLLDSMGVWEQVDYEFLSRRGFVVPDDYMLTIAAMQFREIADYTIDRFGLRDSPEDLMREWSELAADSYAHDVPLKDGAYDYLCELKDSGAKLAVATTLSRDLREPALDNLGVRDLFDAVVDVDMAGAGKKEPAIYHLAADLLGVEAADCTVFEDILVAIESAKSIGMRAWAMYDSSSEDDWPAICAVADGTLKDFTTAPRQL
ncbi:HAD family hydrolase [Bifidobacterium choloepi]|uniref:HAD family phosphatase n=1 Tax=Bifidobacterium choloepi TaxID=2614131 RepID=A0A6I5NIP7_9BIFI|nr:HAD family phosphatase [Bifidobacterium choloepi]NEG70253.1 HAD family phosphatase [Bifidobacterium choloepi]